MKYRFGAIEVDARARTLVNAGVPGHLTRKAFDLLLLLLEHRPDAVSKERIYVRLWPDTFVAEASMQTLIHEIRQAIDERHARESWIGTVHGIGYRFVGDVVLVERPRPAPLRPAAWLVGESLRVALYPGENVVGRDADDVIQIDAPTVSRRHARITVGAQSTIEDCGSKNGTWLNGERVTEARPLAEENVVSLGAARFVFRLARRPQSTESSDQAPTI